MIEEIKNLETFSHFEKGALPTTTPENLKIIVDKINEVVNVVNQNQIVHEHSELINK